MSRSWPYSGITLRAFHDQNFISNACLHLFYIFITDKVYSHKQCSEIQSRYRRQNFSNRYLCTCTYHIFINQVLFLIYFAQSVTITTYEGSVRDCRIYLVRRYDSFPQMIEIVGDGWCICPPEAAFDVVIEIRHAPFRWLLKKILLWSFDTRTGNQI